MRRYKPLHRNLDQRTLKELRSYFGAVNPLIKFIPNPAQIMHGFRDLIKEGR